MYPLPEAACTLRSGYYTYQTESVSFMEHEPLATGSANSSDFDKERHQPRLDSGCSKPEGRKGRTDYMPTTGWALSDSATPVSCHKRVEVAIVVLCLQVMKPRPEDLFCLRI